MENWNECYELAKKYYEKHNNLKIIKHFKTMDGISYDENGIELGLWIINQRRMYKCGELSDEKIIKLNEIHMLWDAYKENWERLYKLAETYYNHYGNLEIRSDFKTIDGINYDENGVSLGGWIVNLRRGLKGNATVVLSKERIKKLNKIGMIWDVYESEWKKNYELAETYYNHYSDLKIRRNFKTLDGINYDENGISLGSWIHTQRRLYKLGQLSKDKINQLTQIGIIWNINEDEWHTYYQLAKKYYENYGNLIIPRSFKTFDGITMDENGYPVGKWISTQRNGYKKQGNRHITEERIEKLNKIGMVWDVLEHKFINQKITEENVHKIQTELLSRLKDFLEELSFSNEVIESREEVDTINCLFNSSIDSSKRNITKTKKVSK